MSALPKVISMDEHRKIGPRLEDGHVRVANELYDAILEKLNTYRHLKVALAIVRKTYGYRKKEDDLTVSQLAKLTGIHRNNVGKALTELEEAGVINPVRPGEHGLIIGINKHHEEWATDEKKERGPGRSSIKLVRDGNQIDCETSNQNVAQVQSKQCIEAIKTLHGSNQNVAHNIQPQKTTPKDNPNSSPATESPDRGNGFSLVAQPAELLSAVAAKTAKPRKAVDEAALEASRAVWSAYSAAYQRRYGTTPIRPARVNAQIKKLIETVGREDAPALAGWFVGHPAQWYVTKGHDIGLLLADITKLHTEWATGRVVTSTAARQSDRRGAMASALQNLLAECEGRQQ